MTMYRIFTNNNLVYERFQASHEVAFTSGPADDLLHILEERLQSGWQLITVALPPNVPLIRSNICTVVLRKTGQRFDALGIRHLCRARERRKTLAKPVQPHALEDLKMIDALFLEQSLREIGIPA
jgi:hypothetical protein